MTHLSLITRIRDAIGTIGDAVEASEGFSRALVERQKKRLRRASHLALTDF